MSTFVPAAQTYSAISSYRALRECVVAGVLFGSAAVGRSRPDSDVDVALLFAADQEPDDLSLLDLRADLEQISRRDVELIMLNHASPILAFQIAKHGRLLFCRDRTAYQEFLVRLISEYADFKIVRRPIEEVVLSRTVL